MVPVEEGEEGELPEEGLVDSRGERERVAAGAAEPPEGVLGQGGHDGHGGGDQRHPPDQGLEKLERAKGLLLEGGAGANIHDVKKLLKQSKAAFFEEHSRSLSQEGAGRGAGGVGGEVVVEPWRGAPLAAAVCIASELAFPEAIALVRWFCSMYVASLCEVARVAEVEAKKLEKEGKSSRKARASNTSASSNGNSNNDDSSTTTNKDRQSSKSSGESAAAVAGASAGTGRAARLLRVLISAFNAFLRHCSRGRMYSKTSHVHVLDIAVSLTRKVIEKLAAECSVDPAAGTAAARLRGLTATACFVPLSVPDVVDDGGDDGEEGPPNFDNLERIGNRDVEKLLVCISPGKAKKDMQYLRLPGSCVEAIGALRSVAVAAPKVYPTIAEAFAAAVRCLALGGDSAGPEGEGDWGGRPALKDAAVRHTLFACSSHLADSLGKSPNAGSLGARRKLVSALEVCYVMRGSAANSRPLPLPTPPAADPDGAKAGTPVAVAGEDKTDAGCRSPAKRSKVHLAARVKDRDAQGTVQRETAGQAAAVATAAAAQPATTPSAALPSPPSPPPSAEETAAPVQAAAPGGGARRGGAHATGVVEVNGGKPKMSGGAGGCGFGRKRPRSPSPLQHEAEGEAGWPNRGARDPASPPARPPPLPRTISNTAIAAIGLPPQFSAAAALLATTSSATPGISNRTIAVGTGAAAAETPVDLDPASFTSAKRPPPPPPSLLPSPLHSKSAKPYTSCTPESPGALGGEGDSNSALMAALFGEEEEAEEDDPYSIEAEAADEATPGAAVLAAAAASLAAEVAAATVDAGFPNPEQRMASLAPTSSPPPTTVPATSTAAGATKRTETRPMATKSYPPLKSAPEKEPKWQNEGRYEVVLGESFHTSSGNNSGGGGGGDSSDGPFGQEQYVHLKYDFVPARTNLDAPATLRQRPQTGAEGRWKGGVGGGGRGGGRGGVGSTGQQQQQRWAAGLEYESRDPSNSEPVRFSGDATRAQDVECVLVFDGKQFLMDRVSVVGGLKNIQNFTDPGERGAGEPTPEAAMAKKKKGIKGMRSMKEREEKRKAKAAEKAVEMAAKAAARAAAKAAARAAAKEEKALARAAAKSEAARAKSSARAAAMSALRQQVNGGGGGGGGGGGPATGNIFA